VLKFLDNFSYLKTKKEKKEMEESVKVLKNALSCLPEGNGDIVLGVLKEKPALIYQFVQDWKKKWFFRKIPGLRLV